MSDTTLNNLLERHAVFLSFVQRRVEDRALAEDILQSAYLRVLQRSGTLRDQGSAVAWFYSILRHSVIDNIRAKNTENRALERWVSELEQQPETASNAAPDAFTRDLVCNCIDKLLPTLKPQYAAILREVDLAEKPLADYAKQHGLSSGNAAVRAHRARAALKRELARVCGICSLHGCLECSCKASPGNGSKSSVA